jgi:hypothetical protein
MSVIPRHCQDCAEEVGRAGWPVEFFLSQAVSRRLAITQ